jgi:hypothetical protein
MTKKTASPTITNHRDSGTGQFVTKQYVKTHPKTTTTEHNPAPKTSSKPSGK